MPTRPLRPCPSPGCPSLVSGGRCAAHRTASQHASTEARRAYDARRGSSAARGYGSRWQKYRARYLAQHPLCADPFGAHGATVVGATVVDHVVAHKGDHKRFWDPKNHQPLCASCHGRKSAIEPGGRAHRGWVPAIGVATSGDPISGVPDGVARAGQLRAAAARGAA
jgi:5-methylcytosine-specific restriction protein A